MLDPDAPGGAFTHWLIYRMRLASPTWPPYRPAPRKVSMTSEQRGYGGPYPPRGASHADERALG